MSFYNSETKDVKVLSTLEVLGDSDAILVSRGNSLVRKDCDALFSKGGSSIKLKVNVDCGSRTPEVIVTSSSGQAICLQGSQVEVFIPYFDTWTIKASVSDKAFATETIEISEEKEYIVNIIIPIQEIYGIRRDTTSLSPEWTRTDDSIGKTATASVGNSIIGSSDFDGVYPWSEMKRYISSSGDILVYIPEFYYHRDVTDGIETIKITKTEAEGFERHPGSGCYIGAYLTGSGYVSKSGMSPLTAIGRDSLRTAFRNRGAGYELCSIATRNAIQMLYLVEFANYNSQALIGNATGCTKAVSGATDALAYKTGCVSSSGMIVYRNIEGLWGVAWEITDGCIVNSTTSYLICEEPDKCAANATGDYYQLSYSVGSIGSSYYIKVIGYDENHPWVMLPKNVSGASDSTYCCDTSWMYSGCPTLEFGGIQVGAGLGMFCCGSDYANAVSGNISSRLAYYPSLDPSYTTTIIEEGGET